jgi:asparaginyl-tRNA synthetase
MFDIDEYLQLMGSTRLRTAVSVQTKLISIIRDFLLKNGFVELLPVIISPFTDPLTDYRVRGEIECYGFNYQITKSMIFHKQLALRTFPKIFSFSPNVRIEPAERQNSGRHLIEFVQVDLEVREAGREQIIELGERLFSTVIREIRQQAEEELALLGRKLPSFSMPYQRVQYSQAKSLYGQDFELKLSAEMREPVWLLDFPLEEREFYDREDEARPGELVDMDLIYPEGYGEALSGGEREYLARKIKNRIIRKGIDLQAYKLYLDFAERGLFPSAGFGFGLERLTCYVCGYDDIGLSRMFAKKPGAFSL